MALIEGDTLDFLAEKKSLSENNIVGIVRGICKGLSAAHSAGIVHRDIKLSNIILDKNGEARILDFGLAATISALTGDSGQRVEGTIRYMAPELLVGKPASPASDLFSVGAICYQLLTGQPAFSGEYEAAVKYSVINESPPPVSTLAPDTSPKLDAVVMKLLEKNPENRYQSAEELIEDLRGPFTTRPEQDSARRALPVVSGRVLISFIVLALLAATVLFLKGSFLDSRDNDSETISLAVLPFDNSGDSLDNFFTDGVTAEVTGYLARQNELRVISRRSTTLYRHTDMPLGEIGRQLDVKYFVVGTVGRYGEAGDSVKVRVELISAEDDAYLWTHDFYGSREDIFAVESEIALMVAEALQVSIVNERTDPEVAPTTDLRAYDYYQRGNEYFARSWTRSDIVRSSELYEKAIMLDSTFASAWAMLSRARSSMYWEYYDHTSDNCDAAFEAAKNAVDLRPDLPEGYTALGYYYYHCNRNLEMALDQFRLGLRIDKNNSELHNAVAAVLRRKGRLNESVISFKTALELDPRSHLKSFDVALAYGMMRQYEASREYIERTLNLAPDYSLGHLYYIWLPIFENGDLQLAEQLLSEAMNKADLTDSKYYWWLKRFIGTTSNHTTKLTAGADSSAYYLYQMRTARRNSEPLAVRVYADSARMNLASKLIEFPEDGHYLSSYALAMTGLGYNDSAFVFAQSAVESLPSTREAFDAPLLMLNFAEVLVLLEKYDEAIEVLNQVLGIPGFASQAYLRVDPMWTPLHTFPRFAEIAGLGNQFDSSEVIP